MASSQPTVSTVVTDIPRHKMKARTVGLSPHQDSVAEKDPEPLSPPELDTEAAVDVDAALKAALRMKFVTLVMCTSDFPNVRREYKPEWEAHHEDEELVTVTWPVSEVVKHIDRSRGYCVARIYASADGKDRDKGSSEIPAYNLLGGRTYFVALMPSEHVSEAAAGVSVTRSSRNLSSLTPKHGVSRNMSTPDGKPQDKKRDWDDGQDLFRIMEKLSDKEYDQHPRSAEFAKWRASYLKSNKALGPTQRKTGTPVPPLSLKEAGGWKHWPEGVLAAAERSRGWKMQVDGGAAWNREFRLRMLNAVIMTCTKPNGNVDWCRPEKPSANKYRVRVGDEMMHGQVVIDPRTGRMIYTLQAVAEEDGEADSPAGGAAGAVLFGDENVDAIDAVKMKAPAGKQLVREALKKLEENNGSDAEEEDDDATSGSSSSTSEGSDGEDSGLESDVSETQQPKKKQNIGKGVKGAAPRHVPKSKAKTGKAKGKQRGKKSKRGRGEAG